jgi:hypothetical protein
LARNDLKRNYNIDPRNHRLPNETDLTTGRTRGFYNASSYDCSHRKKLFLQVKTVFVALAICEPAKSGKSFHFECTTFAEENASEDNR